MAGRENIVDREPRNIFQSTRTFHIFSKFCGLSLYGLDVKTGDVKATFLNTVLLGMFLISYAGFVYLYVDNLLLKDVENQHQSFLATLYNGYSEVSVHFLNIEIVCFFACSTYLIHYDWVKRNEVQNFLQSLNSFDVTYSEHFGFINNSTSSMEFVIRVTLFPLFLILTRIFLWPPSYWDEWFLFLFYTMIFVLLCMIAFLPTLRFIFSTIAVVKRLRELEKNLSSTRSSKVELEGKILTIMETEAKSLEEVEILPDLYNSLSKAVDAINAIYSNEVMVAFLVALIILTRYIYCLFRILIGKEAFVADPFIMSVEMVFILLTISNIGFADRFGSTVDHFSATVGDTFVHAKTSGIEALVALMNLRPLKLASGYFDINLPIVLAMIAAVGNYLIIICQFEISSLNFPNGTEWMQTAMQSAFGEIGGNLTNVLSMLGSFNELAGLTTNLIKKP